MRLRGRCCLSVSFKLLLLSYRCVPARLYLCFDFFVFHSREVLIHRCFCGFYGGGWGMFAVESPASDLKRKLLL